MTGLSSAPDSVQVATPYGTNCPQLTGGETEAGEGGRGGAPGLSTWFGARMPRLRPGGAHAEKSGAGGVGDGTRGSEHGGGCGQGRAAGPWAGPGRGRAAAA